MGFHLEESFCIISASLSINTASVSVNDVDLSPIPSVGLSICVRPESVLWQNGGWIRMPFRMVSGVGQGMCVLDGDGDRRRRGGSLG